MPATKTTKRFVGVSFTWALPGGMWLERESGDRNWYSYDHIASLVGDENIATLVKIADISGLGCGCWHYCDCWLQPEHQ